ncbi:hypothetical protein BHU72_12545 [Desulfuribacillus stibiiarsenatis]|uniref:Type II secretion system protein GspE N-terminal domain-containing protein n=1 Tax=Desulfuribacillus stibiiarsenatis TaxID=1390249 RepID=A0A1E5L292_9FIRM|nr:hypothetical protein [Desulfuribacillus stibiiarsenatis]OEH84226.1 hypothetical protein BHU72_12545 [Desulfuribacillus stibiiarsenatis]
MLSQYFGSFLLNKGYISSEILNELLEQEQSTRMKLGVIAVSKGLLTAAQVEQIHNLQKSQDKKFGELAVELGFFTEEDVDSLLQEQKSSQLVLSQLLIDKGIMDLQALENAVNEYMQDSNLTEAQFEAMQNGNIGDLVEVFLQLPDNSHTQEYMDYMSLFLRNVVRFIDSTPVFLLEDALNTERTMIAVQQNLVGDINLKTYMIMPESTYVPFAARYAQMRIEERNELADASVTEFLNLHNGIFVVNMSEEDKSVNLTPPEVMMLSDLPQITESAICSVDTELGVFYLALVP